MSGLSDGGRAALKAWDALNKWEVFENQEKTFSS